VIDSLYADALLQTDRIFEARTLYEQLDASTPSMTSAVRMAHWHSGQGEHQTAKQWLDIADERFLGTSAYALGWLQLQHGVVHLEQHRSAADAVRSVIDIRRFIGDDLTGGPPPQNGT